MKYTFYFYYYYYFNNICGIQVLYILGLIWFSYIQFVFRSIHFPQIFFFYFHLWKKFFLTTEFLHVNFVLHMNEQVHLFISHGICVISLFTFPHSPCYFCTWRVFLMWCPLCLLEFKLAVLWHNGEMHMHIYIYEYIYLHIKCVW